VAEDLVTDRDRVADALTTLSSLAEVAGLLRPGSGARPARPRGAGPRPVDDADAPAARRPGGADPHTRVRRIEVS
jgi:hypothetical protein